jgi:hypothetical protein
MHVRPPTRNALLPETVVLVIVLALVDGGWMCAPPDVSALLLTIAELTIVAVPGVVKPPPQLLVADVAALAATTLRSMSTPPTAYTPPPLV